MKPNKNFVTWAWETIHACKYDCVLYWKEFADLQHCPTCGETRYKVNHNRGKKFHIRLGMRCARWCWVDDWTTQKVLVGDPSRRPARR
ncbi:hypothetical protein IC582_015593 [Cucumis melo]